MGVCTLDIRKESAWRCSDTWVWFGEGQEWGLLSWAMRGGLISSAEGRTSNEALTPTGSLGEKGTWSLCQG